MSCAKCAIFYNIAVSCLLRHPGWSLEAQLAMADIIFITNYLAVDCDDYGKKGQ